MSITTAKRVLVVEDDPVVAMLVEDIVRDMGYDVSVNLTLEHASVELEVGEIDAVLLDMQLRGENSRPVLLDLLARKIPFLILSGSDQSALTNEFPGLRVLPKPFGKIELEKAVRDLLG
ncbi:response regulator [Rhodanobacter sp. AS-Z3]|uniref:response regulator n=1 Tax=Rhodanobacter sp. AS-Z3 TaxID=3031330 RepID=UPI00247AC626|nr:response regulator [Rhodanobacter sp. AS-Z3]WEN15549.1 response regulator [Rhodanobacter sp. AS-Z3]